MREESERVRGEKKGMGKTVVNFMALFLLIIIDDNACGAVNVRMS